MEEKSNCMGDDNEENDKGWGSSMRLGQEEVRQEGRDNVRDEGKGGWHVFMAVMIVVLVRRR